MMSKLVLSLMVMSLALPTLAKDKKKVQEVNFEEMMMKGAIRNPEGSFLVQKKGLKFYPLYEVQKDFDQRIRESEPEEVLVPARRTK